MNDALTMLCAPAATLPKPQAHELPAPPDCCQQPRHVLAAIRVGPFKGDAVYCRTCKEVTATYSGLYGLFFDWLVVQFWAGHVEVYDSEVAS